MNAKGTCSAGCIRWRYWQIRLNETFFYSLQKFELKDASARSENLRSIAMDMVDIFIGKIAARK